jgi:hypothetical protein
MIAPNLRSRTLWQSAAAAAAKYDDLVKAGTAIYYCAE